MKSIIIVRPKTISLTGFLFTGMESLADLIKFVGKPPVIQMNVKNEPELSYKKTIIPAGSVVFVDTFGNVTNVLTPEQVAERFDVIEETDFSEKNVNKIIPKVIPEKSATTKKAAGTVKK